MDPQERWDQINNAGYVVEQILAWLTLSALLIVSLMIIVRAEWSLLPTLARMDVMCGQELAAGAPVGFRGTVRPEASSAASGALPFAGDCDEVAPPKRSLFSRIAQSNSWMTPFSLPISPEDEP